MGLGLGLGLGVSEFVSSAAASTNWGAWDGTADGAVTNLFTAGGIGGQDIAAVNDEEAVLLYQDSGGSTKAVVLDVDTATNTFKAETTNTAITLTQANATGMNIVRLTATKFVVLYENTTGSVGVVALLTKSGKTLTETDVETSLGLTTPNFRNSLTRLNDTQAVGFMRDDGDGNEGHLFIVDITGDSITIGTNLDTGLDVADYPSVIGLTDSAFMAACTATAGQGGSQVLYCTVSGTTITQADTQVIDPADGTAVFDDMMLGRIDDTTALLAYETSGTPGAYDVNVFTWSGSAIVRHTATPLWLHDAFQGTGTVTNFPDGERRVMFAGRNDAATPQAASATICYVNAENVIFVGEDVTISGAVQADHNTIDATPSGSYIFYAYQDETTVTVKQVGTSVLVAPTTGTANPIPDATGITSYINFTDQTKWTFSSGIIGTHIRPDGGAIGMDINTATYDDTGGSNPEGLKFVNVDDYAFQEDDNGVAADGIQTVGLAFELPTYPGATDDLMSFAVDGVPPAGANNARFLFTATGELQFRRNEAAANETVFNSGVAGVGFIIMRVNSLSDCEVFWNSFSNEVQFDPNDSVNLDRIKIGDRASGTNTAPVGAVAFEQFTSTDALTDAEITSILNYWEEIYTAAT